MRLLCLFRPCNWLHLFNAYHRLGRGGVKVYQCSRCKTLFVGASHE